MRLAETWTKQSTAANESVVSATRAPNLALVDNGTVTDTITIGSGIDIEHVEVVLDLGHTWIGDLIITLTSPDGTESVLVNRPGKTTSNPDGTSQDNIDFTSVQHPPLGRIRRRRLDVGNPGSRCAGYRDAIQLDA